MSEQIVGKVFIVGDIVYDAKTGVESAHIAARNRSKSMDDADLFRWVKKRHIGAFIDLRDAIERGSVSECLRYLIDGGLSPAEIVDKFEVNAATLSTLLGRLYNPAKAHAQVRANLQQHRQDGMSVQEVADRYGVSMRSVQRISSELRTMPRSDLIRKVRTARHGLRLMDGTLLMDYCAALGLRPGSAGYARERLRLGAEGKLLTAEEWRQR